MERPACMRTLTHYSRPKFMDAELKLLSAWEVTEIMLSGTELMGFLERSLSRAFLATLPRVISAPLLKCAVLRDEFRTRAVYSKEADRRFERGGLCLSYVKIRIILPQGIPCNPIVL